MGLYEDIQEIIVEMKSQTDFCDANHGIGSAVMLNKFADKIQQSLDKVYGDPKNKDKLMYTGGILHNCKDTLESFLRHKGEPAYRPCDPIVMEALVRIVLNLIEKIPIKTFH